MLAETDIKNLSIQKFVQENIANKCVSITVINNLFIESTFYFIDFSNDFILLLKSGMFEIFLLF